MRKAAYGRQSLLSIKLDLVFFQLIQKQHCPLIKHMGDTSCAWLLVFVYFGFIETGNEVIGRVNHICF